jgi:hypothetical protein
MIWFSRRPPDQLRAGGSVSSARPRLGEASRRRTGKYRESAVHSRIVALRGKSQIVFAAHQRAYINLHVKGAAETQTASHANSRE